MDHVVCASLDVYDMLKNNGSVEIDKTLHAHPLGRGGGVGYSLSLASSINFE